MTDPRRIQWLVDGLLECSQLSEWEEKFVASISDQFQRNKSLSEKQTETLTKIYDERTQ